MEFVTLVKEGGRSVADAARQCGVSRPTAYRWLRRYEREGQSGLHDRSKAPHVIPHKTPQEVEDRVLQARRQYPTWGPKKIRAWLGRREAGSTWPAASTMGEILERAGMVMPRRTRRRTPASTTPLSHAMAPNDVWSLDFKGQFRLGNGRYCYPLTVTDNFSRMLLGCFALEGTRGQEVRQCLEEVFSAHGLPTAMRSDNGSPFASNGILGMSSLGAWWMTLGMKHERIDTGHPEQNGRHERMHLTLKQETTRPPAHTMGAQQERFDSFRTYFNEQRPHEALDMQTPASVHVASSRAYREAEAWDYSRFDDVRVVAGSGCIRFLRSTVGVTAALAGHEVGLIELDDDVWLVHFCGQDLGLFEVGETSISPLEPHHRSAADSVGSLPSGDLAEV
jgi:transposase InsO family protein